MKSLDMNITHLRVNASDFQCATDAFRDEGKVQKDFRTRRVWRDDVGIDVFGCWHSLIGSALGMGACQLTYLVFKWKRQEKTNGTTTIWTCGN